MVDFKKKLNKGEIDKKINPIDIYDNLDRKSIAGPLRPAQSNILSDWFNNKQKEKDLIIKLHTGEGKTLIGLLILQSKLNQNIGPCAFVCPNIYLAQQVALEAQKFGILYCVIGVDNELPNDFLECKKILIVHIQKVFNGKTKFGLDHNYTHLGCIVLDDSHACIDSIKNAFTIKIQSSHELYGSFLQMFETDLREQGEGSFLDVQNGVYNSLLPIPYWAWIDKKSEIASLLSKFKDEGFITFSWPIIKNCIENCQAFISGNQLEIVPYNVPIGSFGSFSKANQRILMSATTQDDTFFIKGLGFSIDSVKEPLTNGLQKWSGEKMLLIPSLIDESLDRTVIVSKFAHTPTVFYGRVALVSSFKIADEYQRLGASVATSEDIFDKIKSLKSGHFEQTVVIVNRYDGIDLPDEACRILILDSLPYSNSLVDKYEEICRLNSDIVNIRIAQKIEQGLGRSVRGEKDYSIILIIGADLVKFIKSVKTNKYFSTQTKKQIEIGFQIAEMAKDDLAVGEPAFKVVSSLIRQSLLRDPGWKEFYTEEMDKIQSDEQNSSIYEVLQLEKKAEDLTLKNDYEGASNIIQNLIDTIISDDSEKGWYRQILARYKYFISKTESNKIQKSAFEANCQLLKPRDGISYRKIEYINENRIFRIRNWISKFKNYEELILNIESLLNDLSFGVEAEKFESAIEELGCLLGFISQRPDKEFRKGPDNLWCGVDNKYFLIECKSEVDESREDINKHEAGQMNSHCGWFEGVYGVSALVKNILIIPTRKLSYYSNFTHKVEVMRKGTLKSLKHSVKSFIKEFMPYKINELSDQKIQEFLNTHKLDITSLENEYTEDIKK